MQQIYLVGIILRKLKENIPLKNDPLHGTMYKALKPLAKNSRCNGMR